MDRIPTLPAASAAHLLTAAIASGQVHGDFNGDPADARRRCPGGRGPLWGAGPVTGARWGPGSDGG